LLGSVLGYRQYIRETFEESVQPILQNHPQLWPEEVASLEAFAWAFGIVRSRTHPPFMGEDIALVPLADLVRLGEFYFPKKTTISAVSEGKGNMSC
jgi:[ribulose-bisphosphate carboxylase]-lysine N-methyltransferase